MATSSHIMSALSFVVSCDGGVMDRWLTCCEQAADAGGEPVVQLLDIPGVNLFGGVDAGVSQCLADVFDPQVGSETETCDDTAKVVEADTSDYCTVRASVEVFEDV